MSLQKTSRFTDPERIAVVNTRVWTGADRRPWADALLTDGERIVFVGSSAEVMKRSGAGVRVIDARDCFVTPGFIDSHIHFLAGGLGLSSVQLRDASTPYELTRRIAEFAAGKPGGTWIRNGDWDPWGQNTDQPPNCMRTKSYGAQGPVTSKRNR